MAEQSATPFAEVLHEIRGGTLHDELTEQLARVVEGVSATGKAGKVTLTLTVKKGPARGTVLLVDDLKQVVPVEKDGAIFYERDGILSTRHPNQPPLWPDEEKRGPRAVPARPANVDEHGEIRETGAGA